jgi:hypothetical protein
MINHYQQLSTMINHYQQFSLKHTIKCLIFSRTSDQPRSEWKTLADECRGLKNDVGIIMGM